MKGFTNNKSFKILLIAVVVLLVIIIFTTAAGGSLLSSILGFATKPTQKISTGITNNVQEFLDLDLMTTEELKKYSQELSDYAKSLTKQVVDYEEIKRQNEQLKKQLEIEEESEPGMDYLAASVIARDVNDVFYGSSIDKGYLHDVSKDDVVIAENGLVGIVSEVYAATSVVKTIYSEDVRASVIAQEYDETGVLNSDIITADSGLVRMSFLKNDTEITPYTIITTSGASATYPSGITVGYVIEVEQSNTDVSKYAMIRPIVDIKNVRDVFVITGFPGKDEMPEESTGSEASQNQDVEAGS